MTLIYESFQNNEKCLNIVYEQVHAAVTLWAIDVLEFGFAWRQRHRSGKFVFAYRQ